MDGVGGPGALCGSGGGGCCSPPLLCLLLTLVLTSASTALLVVAVVTDHWEHVAWNRAILEAAATRLQSNNATHWKFEWLLDGQVARLFRQRHRQQDALSAGGGSAPGLFFVPMNGGIWTLCAALSDDERRLLQGIGFTHKKCINYLAAEASRPDSRPDWQHRMQNLSISCALVCLIILGACALVGAFGVLAHQISAVLVTGVMYLLAATFALFTLTIIHFKRAQNQAGHLECETPTPLTDGVSPSVERLPVMPPAPVWDNIMEARTFQTAWSLQLGWGGVAATAFTAGLWIMLSKVMRYNPLNT